MTEIKQQFIQVKTKSNFESRLNAGDIKDTSIAFIEDTNQIWAKGKYYSAVPENGKLGQFLTCTESGESKWDYISNLENIAAYGVQFDSTVSDPHLTRIGNMDLHKSLPIQSKLKGCVAQANKVMYWLNKDDWRFRKNPITKSVTLTVSGDTYTIKDSTVFSTLQYEQEWIKIDNVPCQIESVDTSTTTATLIVNNQLKALNLTSGSKVIELGSVLNGYDGTVRVYCPRFYIKSETKDTISKVWISEVKIDDTWTEQPEILVDAYRCTLINTVPENMGYLTTLPKFSPVSIVNTKEYCRGGANDKDQDKYLKKYPFKTFLGKPTVIGGSSDFRREEARIIHSEVLSYDQYKNIFYWLYVIEYANIDCREEYKPELTSEGYHQGGLGTGVTEQISSSYVSDGVITPCGYCNSLGNNTGIITANIESIYNNTKKTLNIPRWRGFDNIFGDTEQYVDGILLRYVDGSQDPPINGKIHIANIPEKYGDISEGVDQNKFRIYTLSESGKFEDSYITYKRGWIGKLKLGSVGELLPEEVDEGSSHMYSRFQYSTWQNNKLLTLDVGGSAGGNEYCSIGSLNFYTPTTLSGYDTFRTVSTSVDLSNVSE